MCKLFVREFVSYDIYSTNQSIHTVYLHPIQGILLLLMNFIESSSRAEIGRN